MKSPVPLVCCCRQGRVAQPQSRGKTKDTQTEGPCKCPLCQELKSPRCVGPASRRDEGDVTTPDCLLLLEKGALWEHGGTVDGIWAWEESHVGVNVLLLVSCTRMFSEENARSEASGSSLTLQMLQETRKVFVIYLQRSCKLVTGSK